ncbi:MAG TPA: Gfo/Idh/MocA family oxidoreductase [Streptosporangiaceae bacterium]|nr:Gfo/Idh/MocA family oxidoreductase [Streptosporangiaceae bacterium]
MPEPVTMAVLGAGSRGTTYAGFAAQSGGRAEVVAVVEPRAERRETLAGELGVPADMRFADWRELAARPRLADAVIVATPDREHVGPAIAFAGLGYHVLLEKPIAPTWDECVAVVEAVERAGVILAVCHVMRYTAYTGAVRRAVAGGAVGQVVGVEHLEPVGWWHFAHSYVRGNWRREDSSGPSLLTKCCHDLDWLRHITGRPAVSVSSRGGLHHFTASSRPPGAADRCLDCAVEPSCPYSATRLYLGFLDEPKRRTWPLPVLTTDLTERGVRQALRAGPYGRCVYACDNDVADHQVVTIEFEGGVTATLTMSAFTPHGRRRTRIMGTSGFLEGDGHQVTVTDFVTGRAAPVELTGPPGGHGGGHDAGAGHDGGDYGAIGAFVDAVASGDRSLISTGPRESLESHRMAFAAERSRLTGAPVAL